MNNNFTPAPWAARHNGHYWEINVPAHEGDQQVESYDPSIAHVSDNPHYPHTSGRDGANAHLIAAAPELYEALIAARVYVKAAWFRAGDNDRGENRALDMIDGALAKVRGDQP